MFPISIRLQLDRSAIPVRHQQPSVLPTAVIFLSCVREAQ
jgi:hypothetical protein